MLHQANDIISRILLVAFFIVMAVTPLVILVLGVINFIRASTRRGTIVLQALVALMAWTMLTYAIVMVFMVVVFSLPYPLSQANELKTTAGFIVAGLIYAVAGAALVYWTKRQARLSRAA